MALTIEGSSSHLVDETITREWILIMSGTKEKRSIVKKVDGVCALFSDGTIRLDNVIASYPWLGKPQKGTNEKTGEDTWTFSCQALMPKATHKAAMQMCKDAVAKLEATKPEVKGKPFKVAARNKFIKDGDAKDEDGDRLYPTEAEGMWMVSSRERNRPQLRGATKDPKTGKPVRLTPEQAQQMFYGGCIVSIQVRPWLMDNEYGKRINAGLVAVQFKKDGTPFGEGRISEEDVDDSFDADDDDAVDQWGDDDDDL